MVRQLGLTIAKAHTQIETDGRQSGWNQLQTASHPASYSATDKNHRNHRIVQAHIYSEFRLSIESFLPDEKLRIASGVLKATDAHLYLAWIHPFGDGNGRTARLVEFQLLLLSGVPTAAAHLLRNHYNLTRTEYYRQLDLASKSGGDFVPFIKYALQGLNDGLNEQLQTIRAQQFHVFWINHVHGSFHHKVSPTDLRRRQLVVDLSEETEPVPIVRLRYLSPGIAEAYAGKTDQTIRRDVNVLERMDLIRRSFEGVEINRELMSAFLSPTIGRDQT